MVSILQRTSHPSNVSESATLPLQLCTNWAYLNVSSYFRASGSSNLKAIRWSTQWVVCAHIYMYSCMVNIYTYIYISLLVQGRYPDNKMPICTHITCTLCLSWCRVWCTLQHLLLGTSTATQTANVLSCQGGRLHDKFLISALSLEYCYSRSHVYISCYWK